MNLARVVGRVVATIKDPGLVGQRLLIVQPVDRAGRPRSRPRVMLDRVGAGSGELVFYVHGKEAALPFRPVDVPTDALVVGIVDRVDAERGPAPAP